MKFALVLALKIAASIALLALMLARVPLRAALDALAALPLPAIAQAVGLYVLAHAINAARLRLFLPALTAGQSLRFTFIALFYGAALPGQLAGDAVKALRLMRLGGDAGLTAAAVILDKIVGLFALLLVTTLGLGLEAPVFGARTARAASTLVMVVIAGFSVIAVMPPSNWPGAWGRALRLWSRTRINPSTLAGSLVLGLLFQAVSIGVFIVIGRALGMNLTPAAWAVVVGFVSLALLLPITVAGVGLRDASLVTILSALAQPASTALALSFALLALTLLGAALGLIAEFAGRDRT